MNTVNGFKLDYENAIDHLLTNELEKVSEQIDHAETTNNTYALESLHLKRDRIINTMLAHDGKYTEKKIDGVCHTVLNG